MVTAAFNKLRGLGAGEIYAMVNATLPCLTTDMSNSEIMGYVSSMISNRPTIGGNYRLPVNGSFSDQIIRGMMVLVPDLKYNSKMLQQYLYGDSNN